MPTMLTGREKKDVVEAGVSWVAIIERLEGVGVGSLVEDDVAWTDSFSILVARNDDCDLVPNREVVTMFVPNTVEPY